MRQLCLIGMAPPEDKETGGSPHPCGSLTDLVALDPRHGVFPNLVMTPLLATLSSLRRERPDQVEAFWDQVEVLLSERSDNRFNLLLQPKGDRLELSSEACERIRGFDTTKSLWAVFGYWTVAALVTHLSADGTSFSRREIKRAFSYFMRRICAAAASPGQVAQRLPAQKTAVVGMLHRLCTADGEHAAAASAVLQQAVAASGVLGRKGERMVEILRAVVPLPHNEAYQNVPFGKIQNCFMTGHDPDPVTRSCPPVEVFWRFMGRSICRRLLSGAEEPTGKAPLSETPSATALLLNGASS